MTFASLPMILFILPLTLIAAALMPHQHKQDALALGGLAAVCMSGGFPALILLLISVCGTWLLLRFQPRKTKEHHRRAEFRLCISIFAQVILLMLGRLLLTDMQLIPLLICALQATECMSEYANNRFSVPALHAYFCYQCDLTRIAAGPVRSYPDAAEAFESRSVSAGAVGQGASWCIRGLFQLVCLSLPMYSVQAALRETAAVRSTADALLAAVSFYFCMYYALKGTARIGQGLAKMLGINVPDSFNDPILADSLQDFRRRFLCPLYAWTDRVLLNGGSSLDPAGYFSRMALLLSGLGFVFARSSGGVIWGALFAGLLTAEQTSKPHLHALPVQAKRFLTALLILLSMGLLCGNSLFDCFSFYGSLLGVNGIMLSDTVSYLLRTYWLPLLLCTAGLIPVHQMQPHLPQGKAAQLLLGGCKAAAELFMLLAAYSELLSRYLRS